MQTQLRHALRVSQSTVTQRDSPPRLAQSNDDGQVLQYSWLPKTLSGSTDTLPATRRIRLFDDLTDILYALRNLIGNAPGNRVPQLSAKNHGQ